MYQIKVNDKFLFDIDSVAGQLTVNHEEIVFDKVDFTDKSTHILYRNKSYRIEVVERNSEEKTAIVKVNGQIYVLHIKDQFDQLLKQLGMDNLAANKVLQLKAPMPGLVLNVLVSAGTEVKKGDSLLILEAMKMENMIKSPTDGIIKKIAVNKGDKVEKNELLIVFD